MHLMSNIVAIKVREVFSVLVDKETVWETANTLIKDLSLEEYHIDLNNCLSQELTGPKGGYVILAGIFNYWNTDSLSIFAKELSKRLKTDVLMISLDEETKQFEEQLFEYQETSNGSKSRT